jgi:hypothetical protein
MTSYNKPDNLIDNLRNGHPTLVHGVWSERYVDPANGNFHFNIVIPLGGTPHTMPLIRYQADQDLWWFYDLAWDPKYDGEKFYKMSTSALMDFWGRHYLFNTYTKPFSMTTITID